MGFSGSGSNVLKSHTHDSTQVQDGGSLAFDNITQAGLTAGDITYSDGTHLQRLAIGATPGDSLVVNGAGTAPEWAASTDPHNAGMTVMWAGTNAAIPAGWLLCDGSSVATATYPDLFTALGYAYGGAGANFNLPDLVAKFPKGSATQTATTGGANSVTLSTAQMPSHTHVVTDPGHTHTVSDPGHYHKSAIWNGGGSYWTSPTTGSNYTTADSKCPNTSTETTGITNATNTTGITNATTGSSNSFDNQPAFLELQYIIKT